MSGRRPNPEVQRYFESKGAPCFLGKANHSNHRIGTHTGANQTVPYGDGPFEVAVSRHFVPGYDRTVPPGLGVSALRTIRCLALNLLSTYERRIKAD
jgi:hypothetical protein